MKGSLGWERRHPVCNEREAWAGSADILSAMSAKREEGLG
jgi:hypothetical protein